MKTIIKRTVTEQEYETPCPKCGCARILVCRIQGKVSLNKMKKKFFYARIIKCTNRKCNAIWNDNSSIVKQNDYDNWLKSPTLPMF